MTPHGSLAPDILIIGGGIAGSGLATVLARSGFGVTVIERSSVFRDRIRGESVHPWGVREMDAAGLLGIATQQANGTILPCWTKYHGGTPGEPYRWSDDFPDVLGELSVQHPALQEALLAEAVDAGATVHRPATVKRLAWPDGKPEAIVAIDDTTITLRPRLVVGADGDHSFTRSALGGTGVTDVAHHAIGGALISGIDLPADSAHQAIYPEGFAMVFPQARGTSRLYFVSPTGQAARLRTAPQPESLLNRLRAILPDGAVEHAESSGPIGFFTNAETLSSVTHGPNTVLIGDAAGSNDPSQGHGLSLVFRDIRDLAQRLHDTTAWADVPTAFAASRARDHQVLRAHAQWSAPLVTGSGPDVAHLREQVARAREQDPTAGGFAGIFATGPSGLAADDAARRHFFGEDIQSG